MQNSLKKLTLTLRRFEGLARKSAIGDILKILDVKQIDDAGWIEAGSFHIVASCDGITQALVRADPYGAGYASVVVNVNDVVAKGATPIGYLNVISSSSRDIRIKIAEGIRSALKRYELKVLKGHVHPDTAYDAIDAMVLGVAKRIIPGNGIRPDDYIIVAIDLKGEYKRRGWLRTFNSTIMKNRNQIKLRLDSMRIIAESELASASTDLSGAGIVGSIAMLCEANNVGAIIHLDSIPKPSSIPLEDWLLTYPAIGFAVTTSKPYECLNILRQHELSAQIVGKVKDDAKITLQLNGLEEVFLDLENSSLLGL